MLREKENIIKISKTKQLLALVLTLLMVFALAACGQGGDASSAPEGEPVVSSSPQGANVTEGEDFQAGTGEKPAGI